MTILQDEAVTTSKLAIVGAGFAGIGAAVRLRQQGERDFVVFERGPGVGGTWRDNSYPGCQCDVPSHLYSFSFAPNPDWSRTYSLQPEIADYLRTVALREGVTEHLRADTALLEARWDDAAQCWDLRTTAGRHRAEVLVMANGPLSEPKVPTLPGLENFAGAVFHSAAWDHDHDLTGERVAVVGTGASAIQFVPHVAGQATQLTVFQRTAPWVLPHRDRPIARWERLVYRHVPLAQWFVRSSVYAMRELSLIAFLRPALMKAVAAVGRRHIERSVADPELRAKLTPNYTPGCKRLLLSNDWYRALAQPNVDVVTSAVREVREHGVVDADGTFHEVDTIIFGTGFHVTDNPLMDIVYGRDGRSVAEVFQAGGMHAYKGTTLSGFPNLFFLAGPNTGIGHTSLVVMIEAQIRYLLDALGHIEADRVVVDVRPDAAAAFNVGVQRAMAPTVWNTGGCASWYQDDHGNNPTLWPDFTFKFIGLTRRFDVDAYRREARRSEISVELVRA